MAEQDNQKKSFKDTLNLPHTDFPIRANHKIDDALILERWEKDNLYEKSFNHNKNNEKFILHDGPPYANGHLHIGHAYNKILKDIVCKSQRMTGKNVPVTPGWDCHGLPIEFAVAKENPTLKDEELKKECREYAQKWIKIQKHEFKQLGVLMNWDHPYLTMDFGYEADTLRAFGILVENNYIERKNKTIPWCPSCQTVLASAEIEYQDRKDPSIYVLFTLESSAQEKLFPELTDKAVSFLVWTTTPWTLPLNRAVLLKPHTDYVVLETAENYIIVGKVLADAIAKMLETEKKIVAEFNSQKLASTKTYVVHPLISDFFVPVLLDESVLTDDGTACVHNAPGAGPIDYEVGVKNNLEIYSPVAMDGTFTADIVPVELIGMSVTHAQGWVIQKLLDSQKLLFKTSIKHSYPHCWRCRGGLIFRATKQWFCDLSRNNLKEKSLAAINSISMLPTSSHNRFEATIDGRLEWCLSRQRTWGVPITALICGECDFTYINKEFINEIAIHVAKQGIEYWDNVSVSDLLPSNMNCPECGCASFAKETDILDVWFDSGISHFAVLQQNPALAYPADMYLEGKDQHRGWFQSSLLTSMIIEKTPCTKTIVTHGFTVDQHGRKMSKSLGNVVSPQEMIEKLGTDGLRLWAASIDNSGDAVISEVVVKNVQEVFRKIRNTCRFLLSNINDFNNAVDAIPIEKMQTIDQYALQELADTQKEIFIAYTQYDFTRVFHLLGNYAAVNLSSSYLDIVKDRLYVEKSDGIERRSAQTVCYIIVDTLTKLMAPILSFTAEQISDYYQKDKEVSIHLQNFPDIFDIWEILGNKSASSAPQTWRAAGRGGSIWQVIEKSESIAFKNNQYEIWDVLKNIRSALLKAIEIQREKHIVKHSLEASITIYIDPTTEYAQKLQTFFTQMNEKGESVESFLKEFLIVSQFAIVMDNAQLDQTEQKGLYARVEHAQGNKCPRCWQWDTGSNVDHLCRRCEKIIS